MVLAAGLGTRLRPLTDELPKPLCPIGDRPPIDGILASLSRAGFARAVVNKGGRPRATNPRQLITLRLPADVAQVGAVIVGTGRRDRGRELAVSAQMSADFEQRARGVRLDFGRQRGLSAVEYRHDELAALRSGGQRGGQGALRKGRSGAGRTIISKSPSRPRS